MVGKERRDQEDLGGSLLTLGVPSGHERHLGRLLAPFLCAPPTLSLLPSSELGRASNQWTSIVYTSYNSMPELAVHFFPDSPPKLESVQRSWNTA